MAITLRGTVTYTIINAYMYTSSNPDKNDGQYEILKKTIRRYKAGGPVLIGGDFNADIQSTDASGSVKVVGGHTFDKEHENALDKEGMMHNRDLMIEFCIDNQHSITNTWFEKSNEEKITWRGAILGISFNVWISTLFPFGGIFPRNPKPPGRKKQWGFYSFSPEIRSKI